MKTITGDLLAITYGAILHQVNCKGALGGLAGALWRKYPLAFRKYVDACTFGPMPAGQCILGEATPSLCIVHIFGQIQPGPNTDLLLVEAALSKLAQFPIGIRTAIGPFYAPYKMGCGLGGGNWDAYSSLLAQYIPELTIVKRPND